MQNKIPTMTSFPINRPKFFKVIVEPESNSLEIPTEFCIKHGRELTDHVFLNVPSGKLWKVELVKSDDEILLEKGWENFRDYYSVDFGYFLVFVFDGDSRFSVFVFNRTCTEIEYRFDEETESESDGSVVKGHDVVGTERIADETKLDGEGTESNKGKDNSVDQEGSSSLTGTNFTFTRELTMYSAHRLSILKEIVDCTGIRADRSITLQNVEGGKWDVGIVGQTNRDASLGFCSGWYKFLIDNKIVVGSTMSFELITSSKFLTRVVKTGPNKNVLFEDVRRKGGKYEIVASRDRVSRKSKNVSRTIITQNDDDQFNEIENDHDNDEDVESESDDSACILEENWITKERNGKRPAVVARQEANDEPVRKKLKTGESAEMMKVDGEVTESDKGKRKDIITDKEDTFTKQVMMASAYKLEISKEFEDFTGLSVHEQVTVQNTEGVEWPVSVIGKTSGASFLALGSGWNKFLVDNSVTVGSTMSLKFISSSKFQAQVVKPGPNKRKIFGNVRRRRGKIVIIASRRRVKRNFKNVPRTIKGENHDHHQIKVKEENDSDVGSMSGVSRIMKTRRQEKLELLDGYAKKNQNKANSMARKH